MTAALKGLRILDLTRILAGPTCTQLLGDLGADVVKVENPATNGDDTRQWGPPYVTDAAGEPTDLSAYFDCANRNKRSVAIDLATDEGKAAIRALARVSDVVVENFKPGGLAALGLDYADLEKVNPALVWCSITGYGRTGPNSRKPGYDLMAQGWGGIMSLTGEPDGAPMKVGVGVSDLMCGLYAAAGILAALRHRDATGEGQFIDISLVDAQVAWLINEGTNYLQSGVLPKRRGNAHPNIAPYQVFESADGHVIVAVGNDGQFRRLCAWLGAPELSADPRYAENPDRLANREALIATLTPLIARHSTDAVVAGLEDAGVPVGPVNTLDKVFASDQVREREMQIDMEIPSAPGAVARLIGNPLKMSRTPISYRRPPPRFGEHTDEVMEDLAKDGGRE